jgi:cAMP-dependent protein kinase regulator/CRP/FNR family cyclic AMP-dependent transcriptional regulator/cGMP-dependent protein kinase 2
MGWFDTVIKQIDILRGRFEAFEVDSKADHVECLAILDTVRAEELNRLHGSSALETAAFADEAVNDRLFAIRDSGKGKIVGCIRRTPAEELAKFEGSRAEYRLDVIPPEIRERTGMLSRLAISKDYRKSSAALALFYFLYDDGLERGDVAALLSCEPGLYPGYLRLGFRPIGRVHAGASGGFRVPMILIAHDLAHLVSCRSPLVGRLRSWRGDKPNEAEEWFRHLEAEQGPIDPGITFRSTDEDRGAFAQLTDGLSKHGREELLHHAIEINCQPGDLVLRAGDGGRFMGFVLDGAVEARIDDRVVRTMRKGDLFGEAGVALDSKRSADVVAIAEGTRVLALSRNSINRVGRDSDRAQLWQNISRVLAMRIERVSE